MYIIYTYIRERERDGRVGSTRRQRVRYAHIGPRFPEGNVEREREGDRERGRGREGEGGREGGREGERDCFIDIANLYRAYGLTMAGWRGGAVLSTGWPSWKAAAPESSGSCFPSSGSRFPRERCEHRC